MKVRFEADGDVIVVTGGANGIGRAVAVAAASAGAKVVICDVDAAALAAVQAGHPAIGTETLDVGDREAVMAVFARIERDYGRIDGLICAAAIQPRHLVHETPPDEWRRVMAVNLDGVVWCYQAVINGMIARRRGSIVAFTSGLAHQGWPQAAAYAATKAALVGFAKSAAKEVARHRVKFNLISPGVIDTVQYRAANEGTDHQRWLASTGVGMPEDVVGPLLFLLSDAGTMTASLISRDLAYAAEEPDHG